MREQLTSSGSSTGNSLVMGISETAKMHHKREIPAWTHFGVAPSLPK
jgi:hypothetical protein